MVHAACRGASPRSCNTRAFPSPFTDYRGLDGQGGFGTPFNLCLPNVPT
jgi:hypothetical protein